MITPEKPALPNGSAVFNVHEIAARFPDRAETMLVDTRLTEEDHASARIFRVYHPAPAHYHATCDEYLLVISGRAKFFFGDEPPFELGPGQVVFFKQGTVHGTTEVIEQPFVVFAVDTPKRDPADVIFIHPEDGSPESFIESKILY